MESLRQILLVDQNPLEVQRTLGTLMEYNLANEIDVVRDGNEAIKYLRKEGAYCHRPTGFPALIFFDFSSLNGASPEAFAALAGDEQLKSIPVVVMVSSREERASVEQAGLRNATYMVKPVDVHDLIEALKIIGGSWAFVLEPLQESAGDRGGVMRRFQYEQSRRMPEFYHGPSDSNPPSRG